MKAHDGLLDRLHGLGVSLSIVSGRLKVAAPKGAVTADLMEEMRAHRDELLEILSAKLDMIPGVVCPFCSCNQFTDEPSGWRCSKCDRLAWGWLGGSFVRADFIFVEL